MGRAPRDQRSRRGTSLALAGASALAALAAFAAFAALAACGAFGTESSAPPGATDAEAGADGGPLADSATPESDAATADSGGSDAGAACPPSCSPELVKATGVAQVTALACNGNVVFLGTAAGAVVQVALGNGNTGTLVEEDGGAVGGISRGSAVLYYSLAGAGVVRLLPMDGGAPSTLSGGMTSPRGVRLRNNVVWVATAYSLVRLDPANPGQVPTIATALLTAGTALDADNTVAVVAQPATKSMIAVSQTSGTTLVTNPGVGEVSGLALGDDELLYTSSLDGGSVWRIKGQSSAVKLVDGVAGIVGVCRGSSDLVVFARETGEIYRMHVTQ